MKASSRLKNFCELCRKQCRDENGYICHVNSTFHQKKVEEFKTNPQELIQKYSNQMLGKFIQLLKSKYPGQPKHLETLYNQYEQQARKFIKFSHTKWKNLKQFGEHLASGQVKNIKVSGLPPDCYITYTVNKTMEFIQKNKKEQLQALKQRQKQIFQKSLQNRVERQKAYEEQQTKKFEEQMRKIQKQRQNIIIPDRLQFTFENWGESGKRNAFITAQELEKQVQEKQKNEDNQQNEGKKLVNNQKLLCKIQQLQEKNNKKVKINQNGQDKSKQADDEREWIAKGIIVKILPHQIDPVFHNRKVKILQIVEPYVAKVHLGTATLEVDQNYLQTVIPKIGSQVMILEGLQKGFVGILKEVNLSEGYGVVQIKNKQMKTFFNNFSKYEYPQ